MLYVCSSSGHGTVRRANGTNESVGYRIRHLRSVVKPAPGPFVRWCKPALKHPAHIPTLVKPVVKLWAHQQHTGQARWSNIQQPLQTLA